MAVKDSGFIMEGLVDTLDNTLFTITTRKKQEVVAVLMEWFLKRAQFKTVPDLQNRIVEIEPKLRKMAENLKVSIVEGQVVIKTDAESETLLNLLRRGSDWFAPHPDVNAAILLGLLNGEQAI